MHLVHVFNHVVFIEPLHYAAPRHATSHYATPLSQSVAARVRMTHTFLSIAELFFLNEKKKVVVELPIAGATGVYTTSEGGGGMNNRHKKSVDQHHKRHHHDTLVIVSSSSLLAGPSSRPPGGGAEGTGLTRVLALEGGPRVVELAEGGDDNPFVCDAATVDVCTMAGGTIVQAHALVSY